MRFVALDTETELFSPGNMAPRLVCVSVAPQDDLVELHEHRQGLSRAVALLQAAIKSTDDNPLLLVLQNGAYDFAVLAREAGSVEFLRLVFEAHEKGRIWDTRIVEWLLDTADGVLNLEPWPRSPTGWRRPPKGAGWYSLARLARKYCFVELDKASGVRTNFGYLRGTLIEQWPEEHVKYAKEDASATLGVARAQWERAQLDGRRPLVDVPAQCRAYLALHLVSVWGLTTDLPMVAEYERELERELSGMRESLSRMRMPVEVAKTSTKKGVKTKTVSVIEAPLLERQKDGSWKRNTKVLQALVAAAYGARGLEVPRTDPSTKFPEGQVSTSAEVVEDCEDERLAPWKAHEHASKMLGTYVPVLKGGIVHPRYDFAATGRTTSYDPNIQNLPRKGLVRECYRAREGFYLCSVDYGSQELVTFAQVMKWTIGDNALADALNQDIDPHLMLAATQLGLDYDVALARRKAGDQVIKDVRQRAKGPNFGYPGGMGPDKFVEYMRNQDPPELYTRDEAVEAREAWFETWRHDPRRYFKWVSGQIEDEAWIRQFVSGRVRGGGAHGPGMGFSDSANGYFQALAADMSKAATWEVVRRCYTGRGTDGKPSALEGSRVVAFIHDEILAEVPIARAHEAATEIAEAMLAAGNRYCPDVKSKAEPALMRRWYKGAEAVYEDGQLVPWEPKKEERKVA